MSLFFPILKSNEIYQGSTIVHNFPPNNVQKVLPKSRYLNLIWMDANCWKTKLITMIKPFESREVFYDLIHFQKQHPSGDQQFVFTGISPLQVIKEK